METNTKSKLISVAVKLSVFTIIYNLIEGAVSVYFGLEEDSISLLGFGLDSFVEVASAIIVLIKLKATNPDDNLKNERRATLAIGVLFLILSLNVFGNSIYQLLQKASPSTTVPGVIVSLLSLSFMFYLWKKKEQVANELNSSTVMADAKCSLACIKLSSVLLVGSLIFWAFPALWWVDSVAAIVIGVFILREGWEMIQSSRKKDFKGGCGCH